MVAQSDISISPLLEDLEHVFRLSFNQSWFRNIVEDSPVDTPRFREVEAFFITRSQDVEDTRAIAKIVIAVEEIVSLVKRYLLPRLRDRLRISGFYSHDGSLSKEHKIKYGFIAYAFPYNIKRIETITCKIKEAL